MAHMAASTPAASLWTEPFLAALRQKGSFELYEDCNRWSDERVLQTCRSADVLLTGWGSQPIPSAVACNPGRLKYVCHLTGTLRSTVPLEIIRAGIPVTNWGDAPAGPVAEGALTLLLACLHNLRPQIEAKREGHWTDPHWRLTTGCMDGLRVGLYGFGAIARKFARFAIALGARVSVFDPYVANIPKGIRRCSSLRELFATSDAVSLHAALTDETRGAIQADHLALLPDHGILINTARGALVDEVALFAELASGRLRAGLDVLTTDEEPLPPDHPARYWPNVILTAHRVSNGEWQPGRTIALTRIHRIALQNITRFTRGETPRFLMNEERYALST